MTILAITDTSGALENQDVLELSHVTNFNDDKNKNLGLKTLTPTNTSINASPRTTKRKSPDTKNAMRPLALYNRFTTTPKINGTIKSPSIAAAIKGGQSPPKKMVSALTKGENIGIPNYVAETNDENVPPPPSAPPLPPKYLRNCT